MDGATGVHAADLDGDGDADVLSSSETDNKIAWYENMGVGGFSSQRILTTAAEGARSVLAEDLDGDGDADVLWVSTKYYDEEGYIDSKVAWHENLGGGSFSTERVITTSAEGARSVHAEDLDGDGDADVVSASYDDDKIAWYENMGGGEFSSQRVITAAANGATSVHAADLDGDGDADVLWGSEQHVNQYDSRVAWHENLGGGSFSTERVIARYDSGALIVDVRAADLDRDGDADVLTHLLGVRDIVWHENLGGGTIFFEHNIFPNPIVGSVTSVYPADLDGDGGVDVIAAGIDVLEGFFQHENAVVFSRMRTITAMCPLWPRASRRGTATSGALPRGALGRRDIDYIRIDVSDPGTLVVSTVPDTIGVFVDTFLTLSDASGAVLSRSDDLRIEQTVASGTYYIAIEALNASMGGTYVLLVNFEPDLHGDARTMATPVEAPSDTAGSVHSGDVDWFSVDLEVDGSLLIYTSGGVDTQGSLVDADGMELASDDDSGETYNFRLSHAVAAGVHYVAVRGASDLARGRLHAEGALHGNPS